MRRNCATNYGNTTVVRIPRLHKVRHLMLKRPFKSLIARIAIVALALSLVVPFVPAAFAQGTSIDYAENGTGPVATFSATDQDGDPIEWSLAESGDYKLFTISGGVLAFKKSPDYENPNSSVTGGTRAEQNVYRVTIEAAGGSHAVTVNVTNVDEDGEVSINKPQPQVGRGLEATLEDPDGGQTDEKWQWARSEDGEAWADIAGATAQSRNPMADDVGNYLRATVTYSDSFGNGKTAMAVTANAVEPRTVANAAPLFTGQDDDSDATTPVAGIQVNRSVTENTAVGVNIGKPVSASDADNDILIYELVDSPDLKDSNNNARFTISDSSGQIKVGKKLGADTGEPEDQDSATAFPAADYAWLNDTTDGATAFTAATTNVYILLVKATDPSGASATQPVAITVTEVNEAPVFDTNTTEAGIQAPATTVMVAEDQDLTSAFVLDADPDATDDQPYTAVDNDAAGDDAANARSNGTDPLDYEVIEPADENNFSISAAGVLSVNTTAELNYEERSSYSITIVASSGTGTGKRTSRLDVTVKVTNAEDDGTISLSQREPQVGRAVIATVDDEDGGVTITGWQWYRGGAPTDTNGVRTAQVDISGVTAGAAGDCSATNLATATDPCRIKDATSASYTPVAADFNSAADPEVGFFLTVQATYTDNVDSQTGDGTDTETPTLTSEADVQLSNPANAAPSFPDQDPNTVGDQSDSTTRSVAENTKAKQSIGAAVGASDPGEKLLYTLGGQDAESFAIAKNTGQLMTKAELDFETKATYMVVVTATDPSGATDSILVTINVTDEDDPADITADSSIDYAENGTGPVATFSATDQDGDPIEWSLAESGDYKLFTISGGVLAFEKSPDYENPNSSVTGGTRAEQNVYRVTIEAAGGSHAVTVTVTNVDEDGEVTIDKPQPQVGRGLEATLEDPDGGQTDEKWQWARSEDGEAWTEIAGATAQSRNPVADDVGNYLRATVTYTDSFGNGKTAMAVTANAVEPRTVANAAPSFLGQDDDNGSTTPVADIQVNRSVAENTAVGVNIGKPVSASDADNDVLIYTLGGTHESFFDISSSSGQLKTKEKFDFESPAGTPTSAADSVTGLTYTVTVTATDPSGAGTSQDVTIQVNDVNEAPAFDASTDTGVQAPPTTVTVTENADTIALDGDPDTADNQAPSYRAVDADAVGTDDANSPGGTVTYEVVEPADEDNFSINTDGVLSINTTATVDYEERSSYSITIVASSGAGTGKRTSRLDVTVKVIDAEDVGTISLSQREPQVGRAVIATVDDKDGGVTITGWQWYRGGTPTEASGVRTAEVDISGVTAGATGDCSATNAATATDPCRIKDATSASYTPVAADFNSAADPEVGFYLTVQATYTDNIDSQTGDGTDTEMPTLTSEADVQLSNPANGAPSFPDQDPNAVGDQSDSTTRSVAENTKAGQSIGAAVGASDPGEKLLYTLGGQDAESFAIAKNTGQLMTKAELDYETKATYMVVVTATDPSGATDSILVTINVTDENDDAVIATVPPNTAPAVSGESAVDYAENSAGDVGTFTATDPDAGDTITWSLSGADAASFTLVDGVLRFAAPAEEDSGDDANGDDANGDDANGDDANGDDANGDDANGDDANGGDMEEAEAAFSPDYEAPGDADGDNVYEVTVTATDSSGESDSIDVTVTVTDVDENRAPAFEADALTLSVAENSAAGANVGDPVVATDADEDELAYSLSGDGAAAFEIWPSGQITVAEDANLDYEGDVTSYSVTVTATDPSGATDSVDVTINVTNVGLSNAYDIDDSGDISKDEAVMAVQDFFAENITRGQAIAVIQIYFAG